MKKFSLFLLFLAQFFFATVVVVHAQSSKEDESVVVENVKFQNEKNDWVSIQIDIRAKSGSSTFGTSKNNNLYVDNIKVTFYVAYMKGNDAERLTFYSSEVELLTLEKGKKYTIPFYMCGPVLKREAYNKEPYAYYVEIDVAGRKQKPTSKNTSSRLNDLDLLQKFIAMAGTRSKETEGTLIPIYDLPPTSLFDGSPAYRIRVRK